MQMWVDTAKVADMPADPDAFLEFCKKYPGKVTYPTPGDFTGTAFIECLIAGVVGKDAFEQLAQMEADKEKVRAIIEPGLTYLKSLNPYLWQAGKTFPADHSTLSQMFADGELIMDMGYGSPDSDIEDGIIPNTVRSFLLDTGTVGNENFMAIAKNASHKAAAMVAINEIMSPELQLSIYDTLGVISVLDTDKLSAAQKQSFAAVKTGVAALPADELLAHRIAEASGAVVPLIEALWTEEVVGK